MASKASNHFHEGEIHIQDELGVFERNEMLSDRIMRHSLIDQHREFFAGLEYVFLSIADKDGQPRAFIVTGHRGFLSIPDDKTLRVSLERTDARSVLGSVAVGGAMTELMFINFETGDQLNITGTGKVISGADAVAQPPSAPRLRRINPKAVKFKPGAPAQHWRHHESSPCNPELSS